KGQAANHDGNERHEHRFARRHPPRAEGSATGNIRSGVRSDPGNRRFDGLLLVVPTGPSLVARHWLSCWTFRTFLMEVCQCHPGGLCRSGKQRHWGALSYDPPLWGLAQISVAVWHRDVNALLRELISHPLEPFIVR